MFIKQISVFIENRHGRLTEFTKLLGKNDIDLIALSIADTTNFGILRAIVSDNDKALKISRDAGFTANLTEVLAVAVPMFPAGWTACSSCSAITTSLSSTFIPLSAVWATMPSSSSASISPSGARSCSRTTASAFWSRTRLHKVFIYAVIP